MFARMRSFPFVNCIFIGLLMSRKVNWTVNQHRITSMDIVPLEKLSVPRLVKKFCFFFYGTSGSLQLGSRLSDHWLWQVVSCGMTPCNLAGAHRLAMPRQKPECYAHCCLMHGFCRTLRVRQCISSKHSPASTDLYGVASQEIVVYTEFPKHRHCVLCWASWVQHTLTLVPLTSDRNELYRLGPNWVGSYLRNTLSLSLSLSHTHTHTHTTYWCSKLFMSLLLACFSDRFKCDLNISWAFNRFLPLLRLPFK
jgi:hypothetical protein